MDDKAQVLNRIFDILEYLSQTNKSKGPTEIAQAVDLPKSTVYRLLSAMCQRGYVEKNKEGSYHIGVKLVDIVSNHINNLELQTEAKPHLYDLQSEVQLMVYLGVLDQLEVVYLEKIDRTPNLRLYTQIGLRVPAYCSSLGKCLLAGLSGYELDYLLSGHKLERFTTNTITSLGTLKQHLQQVREQGWAMDDQEYILGNRCIASPIYDYRGDIISAVSASGPVEMITDKKVPFIAKKVKQTATLISRELCYSPVY